MLAFWYIVGKHILQAGKNIKSFLHLSVPYALEGEIFALLPQKVSELDQSCFSCIIGVFTRMMRFATERRDRIWGHEVKTFFSHTHLNLDTFDIRDSNIKKSEETFQFSRIHSVLTVHNISFCFPPSEQCYKF